MAQDSAQDTSVRPVWRDQDVLTEADLVLHWQKSVRTLQRWRAEGYGPTWIVIGGTIRYRWRDIVAFEDRMRRPRARA